MASRDNEKAKVLFNEDICQLVRGSELARSSAVIRRDLPGLVWSGPGRPLRKQAIKSMALHGPMSLTNPPRRSSTAALVKPNGELRSFCE
ncbi:hypothetical protein J6590_071988 [Homalodisca vitripennis]|nr:hypothetical protein J6590_071988 [Homalodisca vitripennis]